MRLATTKTSSHSTPRPGLKPPGRWWAASPGLSVLSMLPTTLLHREHPSAGGSLAGNAGSATSERGSGNSSATRAHLLAETTAEPEGGKLPGLQRHRPHPRLPRQALNCLQCPCHGAVPPTPTGQFSHPRDSGRIIATTAAFTAKPERSKTTSPRSCPAKGKEHHPGSGQTQRFYL